MWEKIERSTIIGLYCSISPQDCDELMALKEQAEAYAQRNSQLRVELEQVKRVANDRAQLAAKYRRTLDAARDAYIKEHSDGETDCVTPFDVYEL